MTLTTLEHRVLVALERQFAEGRRPVTREILMAACNARTTADRAAVHRATQLLARQALVERRAGDRLIPTPRGRAVAAQAPGKAAPPEPPITRKEAEAAVAPKPSRPGPCDACGSVPGQHHAPECPAVNAFTAGRIQGDGTGEALPPIEYPASVERMGPPISVELLNRCVVMQRALMAQTQAAYARGEPGAAGDLVWLIETGERLLAEERAHG